MDDGTVVSLHPIAIKEMSKEYSLYHFNFIFFLPWNECFNVFVLLAQDLQFKILAIKPEDYYMVAIYLHD